MPRSLIWFGTTVLAVALSGCAKPPEDPATRASSPGSTAAATPAGDAGPAPSAPQAEQVAVSWDCDGRAVAADYDNTRGQVRLQIGAELLTLPQAVSASGARYADSAGNEFWEHQGKATLTLAGGKPQPCGKAGASGG